MQTERSQQEGCDRGAELHTTSDEQALDEGGPGPAAAIDAETAAAACSDAGRPSLPAAAGASLELPVGAAAAEATLSLDALHSAEATLDATARATADGLHLVERHQFLGPDGLPIAKGRRVRLCNLTKVTQAAPQVQARMDPASQVSVKAAAVMQRQHGMIPEQPTACLLTFLTACLHAGASGCLPGQGLSLLPGCKAPRAVAAHTCLLTFLAACPVQVLLAASQCQDLSPLPGGNVPRAIAAHTCLLTFLAVCPLQVLLAAFQRQLARRMPTHEEASLQAARDMSAAAQATQWPFLIEEGEPVVASRSMLRPQAACEAAHRAKKPAAAACGDQEAPQESDSTEVG